MQTIFIVIPDMFMIGAQRCAILMAKEIIKDGNRVVIIKLNKKNNLTEDIPGTIKIENLYANKFWHISLIKYFYQSYLLSKKFKFYKPDYSISIAPSSNLVNLLANVISSWKVKIICEEHQHLTQAKKQGKGSEWTLHWKLIHFILIYLYKFTYKLRVVSKSSKKDFINNWSIPPKKVILVEPPIDKQRIDNTLKKKVLKVENSDKKLIKFCSVGRLTTQKDFVLLIKSFARYLDKREGILQIAGEGSEKGKLQDLIDSLGLNQRCKLLGFIDNSDEFIRDNDIFVLTSRWEGFPATLIESLYIGTPVISVNCHSGPKELLLNNEYGLLVKRSSKEISNAMVEMHDNKELRESYIDKGKVRALDFGPEKIWSKYSNLIK